MPKQKPARKGKGVGQSQSKLKWTLGIVVALTGFLLYAGTVNFDYTLDDYSLIKANRLTRQGWDAFPTIVTAPYRFGYYFTQDELYRPVPKAMFAIEWALSPDNPALSHSINVVLYALTGLLLFFTLTTYLRGNFVTAFAASLLFIAHPIHTEVVASIKSRDEILSLFFLLIALNLLHGVVTRATQRNRAAANIWPAMMLMIAVLLSLLSKESGITFLAIFPLAIYFFTDAPMKTNLKASLMLLIPFAILLVLRHYVLGHNLPSSVSLVDNSLMAARTGADRFATAVGILGVYLKLMFFPHPLVFDRSYNDIPIISPSAWQFIAALLAYASLLGLALLRFRRKDGIAFSILYFLISISIFANVFVIIGTSYGERLMYSPSLGFCLGIAFLLTRLFGKRAEPAIHTARTFAVTNARVLAVVGVIVVLYAVKTETRNPVWRDNSTLFSHDVALAPNSARAHYLLGNLLSNPEDIARKDPAVQQATLDAAIAELERSVEIHPAFAEAYNQLGVAYYQKKNIDEAFRNFSKALEYNPGNATYHSNMGLVYSERHDLQGSLKAFQRAVELDPNYSEGLANLGITYGRLKDYDNAVKYLLLCIKTAPDYAKAYYFLSGAYDLKGDKANADRYMSRYKALGPGTERVKDQK